MSDPYEFGTQRTPSEFWGLVFRNEGTPTHIRVPNERYLGAFFIGDAKEMHGPDGCCTCCVRAEVAL